jgi:hypothetical protein
MGCIYPCWWVEEPYLTWFSNYLTPFQRRGTFFFRHCKLHLYFELVSHYTYNKYCMFCVVIFLGFRNLQGSKMLVSRVQSKRLYM